MRAAGRSHRGEVGKTIDPRPIMTISATNGTDATDGATGMTAALPETIGATADGEPRRTASILLVDHEPNVLSALRRVLRPAN